jgi:hypothetical protein
MFDCRGVSKRNTKIPFQWHGNRNLMFYCAQ